MIIEVLGLSSQSLLTLQVDYAISYFLLVYLVPLCDNAVLSQTREGEKGQEGE